MRSNMTNVLNKATGYCCSTS